tara:strand:+ start:1865 stop:2497 length:633 start_codon:yes stop_codon:yes gene_type:complete
MCFSFELSIFTFSIAILSGLTALFLKQYILGILILCYAQIQFSEILIWYALNNNNNKINKIGTQYGKFLLPAHNIAIGLGIYFTSGQILPLLIGLVFYISIIIYYNVNCDCDEITKLPECKSSGKKCDKFAGKLQWPYPHDWYLISFIITTLLLFIYVKPFNISLLIVLFYWFFYVITWFINFYNAYGSYWCWIMALTTPIIVFLCQIFK